MEIKEWANGKKQIIEIGNEVKNYNSIPIGYVFKYKFNIEKKEHHLLEIETKDKRQFKFRFDSLFSH